MSTETYYVLGLMSGSSLDGLDIAYCQLILDASKPDEPVVSWNLIEAETIPFSEQWQARLIHLPTQNALTFAKTNVYFAYYMGDLVNAFIKKHQLTVDFIASHGHTVFHDPDGRYTVQIGDGGALAAVTKQQVICNFRTHDIALNGEGTPLAPIADKLLFAGYDFYLNIGGIANISCDLAGKFIAFDIGAANQVLNILAKQVGLPFDYDGQLAAKGKILPDLLARVNAIDFFAKDYPKSLDNQWILKNIIPIYMEAEASTEDKLRTACEQLALQLGQAVEQVIAKEGLDKKKYTILLSGGGTLNAFLVKCFQAHCPQLEFVIPGKETILFKEAILMALMGALRIAGIPNCLNSVTGADRDTVGGGIYFG